MISKMPGAIRMIAVVSVSAAAIFFSTVASAERILRSLPHVESFDANNYSDLLWLSRGATQTWMPTAGWNGRGAAKFTPPDIEGYCGVGQFILSGIPLEQRPEQLNVRWLLYHGATWREHGPGGKLIIMNREGNRGRPMIIYRDWTNAQGDTWETIGPCDGTVCRYYGGDYWPDGRDTLRMGNRPLYREEEWISMELEANTRTGIIRLYIDTQDGQLSGLYVEQPMVDTGPGGIWSYVDIIGGYMWAAEQQHPDNYFMLDEVVISSQRVGPPPGFVNTSATRPSPPTSQVR
jgi:hypothetical protein